MKTLILFITLFTFGITYGQEKKLVYKKCAPNLNQEGSVLIFELLPEEQTNKYLSKYNEKLMQCANKYYKGEKVFLTSAEIAELDYSEKKYAGIFSCKKKTIEGDSNIYANLKVYGVYDFSTEYMYVPNMIWKNYWQEMKEGVKYAEKCRSKK